MRYRHRKLFEAMYHLFLIAFGVCMLYPLIWMLFSSFKPNVEIFKGGSLLPRTWTIENYISGFKGLSGVTYGKFFFNSFLLVFCCVIGNIVSCSLAAYASEASKSPS